MVDSADDARAHASLAAAALRLVNEVAAESLIAAAGRGETRARVAIDPVVIPFALGRTGRLYGEKLVAALDSAGAHLPARACRIFAALGFDVASVPTVERQTATEHVVDTVESITVDHLELGFAAAPEIVRAAAAPLLKAVPLPAAHLWRARAEAVARTGGYERRALKAIAEEAERGNVSCRLPWRAFGAGPPDAKHLQRVAELLRGRGFRVETIEPGAALQVYW